MTLSSRPWADTPFPLISLSIHTPTSHPSSYLAREMSFAHNGMLRALNSIYQQSSCVAQPADIADVLTYVQFWCGLIHEHHAGEESLFFPKIEEITQVKGLMSGNVAQHHAFEGGVKKLERWVGDVKRGSETWDAVKLRGIIDGFGDKLAMHLKEEIQTLLELEKYDGVKLKEAWTAFDSEMRKGDKSVLFPIVFGTGDSEFEKGGDWPDVPGFVRSLVHYWFERKHRCVWRFNPSTTWGKRRNLIFTENRNEE